MLLNPKSNFTFLDMRQKRYILDAGIQVVVPFLVILLFKLVHERKVAALLAGALFCGVPLLLAIREYRYQKFTNVLWWIGTSQFLVIFALPIFLGRIFFWSMDFEKITVGSLSLAHLHHWANWSYGLMLLGVLANLANPKAKSLEKADPPDAKKQPQK